MLLFDKSSSICKSKAKSKISLNFSEGTNPNFIKSFPKTKGFIGVFKIFKFFNISRTSNEI